MERNCPKVTYSVRYGSDFPHSVPIKGKDMDQQEPKSVPPLLGVVPETTSKFEDRLETDAGNSLPPVRGPRKRKEYQFQASPFDTMIYDRKRIRQNGQRTSRSKEAMKTPKGGSINVDIGGREKKMGGSKHIPFSARPPAPFHLYDGRIRRERVLHLGPGGSETSIASSDDAGDDKRSGGNTSTLTSNEEGDSGIVGCSQLPKLVGQTNTRFARYAVPSKDDSFTDIVRQDVTGARHGPSSGHRTSAWKQTRHLADDEVISGSQEKKTFSSYTARDNELNRVFGVSLWNSQYEKSTEERHKASALHSGYSDRDDNDRSRDTRDTDPDVRSSKPKQACFNYGFSNSSREHPSSSGVTDLCASSGSVSSWLEGERSSNTYHRFKASVFNNMTSIAKLDDEVLAVPSPEKTIQLPCVLEEQKRTTSRSQCANSRSEGTQPASNSSEREPVAPARNMSIGLDDSSGSGPGGSESNKPEPTFVLSSGRLSKSQEAQLGKRPTTIDDDFDQYFAQLML